MKYKKGAVMKMVNQNCKDCIYDVHEPGSWRAQTEACEIESCAIYPIRPFQGKNEHTRVVKTLPTPLTVE